MSNSSRCGRLTGLKNLYVQSQPGSFRQDYFGRPFRLKSLPRIISLRRMASNWLYKLVGM